MSLTFCCGVCEQHFFSISVPAMVQNNSHLCFSIQKFKLKNVGENQKKKKKELVSNKTKNFHSNR